MPLRRSSGTGVRVLEVENIERMGLPFAVVSELVVERTRQMAPRAFDEHIKARRVRVSSASTPARIRTFGELRQHPEIENDTVQMRGPFGEVASSPAARQDARLDRAIELRLERDHPPRQERRSRAAHAQKKKRRRPLTGTDSAVGPSTGTRSATPTQLERGARQPVESGVERAHEFVQRALIMAALSFTD